MATPSPAKYISPPFHHYFPQGVFVMKDDMGVWFAIAI